jgi:hypothetical protein
MQPKTCRTDGTRPPVSMSLLCSQISGIEKSLSKYFRGIRGLWREMPKISRQSPDSWPPISVNGASSQDARSCAEAMCRIRTGLFKDCLDDRHQLHRLPFPTIAGRKSSSRSDSCVKSIIGCSASPVALSGQTAPPAEIGRRALIWIAAVVMASRAGLRADAVDHIGRGQI